VNTNRRVWVLSGVGVLMACVAGCSGLSVTLPGGFVIGFDVIGVTLTNTTDFYVVPLLYADDDDDTFLDSNIVTDENYVDTGVLPPHSSVTITLDCDRAGTLKSDHAIMEIPGGPDVESDNAPKITAEDDFDCGDAIEFIFIDTGREFFTRVEVNGRVVED